ncbi:hypothetical protein PISMIDRAFT_690405 [Pisolithus microcarpus 441]|uniref:Uncharacterized protein n=1 Tax=Pisolithus microcarpus 441 TaxID=765257 RepID=A0A0C9YBR2_9AGAM|nr:hypothetical protein PISMIDRAFT_690405 [Pisolithus microcarpus 441]
MYKKYADGRCTGSSSDTNNSQPAYQPLRKRSQDAVDSQGKGIKYSPVIRPAGRT